MSRRLELNVMRAALQGAPCYKTLKMDLWPWDGTREAPDYAGQLLAHPLTIDAQTSCLAALWHCQAWRVPAT